MEVEVKTKIGAAVKIFEPSERKVLVIVEGLKDLDIEIDENLDRLKVVLMRGVR